ncbi:MAG: N-acetylmuramoyl-L-alanine amidase [Rhodospirillaceae bacterium]|nr:N-acetylmuramoyl-L-alanine amidase [Rhodospirillaceae bacterium]
MYVYLFFSRTLALCLLCFFMPTCQALALPQIAGLRIGDYSTYTRFVLDVTENIDFNVFTLPNPHRVVIDLPEVSWHSSAQIVSRGRRISGYRFGLFDAGRSRVVIDLKSPIIIKKSFIIPRNKKNLTRIVVDIKPVPYRAMLMEIEKTRKKHTAKTAKTAPPKLSFKQNEKYPTVPVKPLVVIDPGHGGVDPGALAISGTLEKHIVLKQAQVLRQLLVSSGRYRVHLTRDRDIFLRLRQRVAIAQEMKADLFLSLHADSIKNRRIRGASIYTLSENASDKEARLLAEKENKSDVIAGIDLNDKSETVARILIDLRQRLTKNNSVRFAERLVNEFKGKIPMLRKNRRYAGFVVLKAPDVPSVLVEMGYLSNRQDERMLKNKKHREVFAKSVVKAVDAYFTRMRRLHSP